MNVQSHNDTYIFRAKPLGFSPAVEVAACYIECNNKILFLKRSAGKSEGEKWGVPAGKIEHNENSHQAVVREVFEETSIVLNENQPAYLGKVFVRKPGIDFVYHMYYLKTNAFPNVQLNNEHQDYQWISMDEVAGFPLMAGALECLHHCKALANKEVASRIPFYFIRHGETDVNADPNIKRVDYDLPLNIRGKDQAHQARKVIESVPLKSVCFSPIQRAVETKDILVSSLNLEHEELDDLSECNAHIWTKMVQLEEGRGFHVCHEVENFLGRTMRGLNTALQRQSPTLLVAHGGIHWALCYHLSIENHPWKIGNCQLVHFQPVGDVDWKADIIMMS